MSIQPESREARFAFRLSQRLRLKPPVDVLAVAKSLADVQEKRFPLEIDGLCLDLKRPGIRPRVWISAELRHHRRRFTLAHEIGHIVIPWHTGSIVDDLDAENPGERSEYREMEGEANRFAAELLMPRAWSISVCARAEHMAGGMHAIANLADVSFQAAALRTCQYGPVGYLVAAVRSGVVVWAGKTMGTQARPPRVDTPVDAIDMPAFHPPQVLGSESTRYYWWKVREGVALPDRPDEPWRQILERMLLDLPTKTRPITRQRINAIVGYALGRLPRRSAAEAMYQKVLEALQNRSDMDNNIVEILRHPELSQYILARIYDRSDA